MLFGILRLAPSSPLLADNEVLDQAIGSDGFGFDSGHYGTPGPVPEPVDHPIHSLVVALEPHLDRPISVLVANPSEEAVTPRLATSGLSESDSLHAPPNDGFDGFHFWQFGQ